MRKIKCRAWDKKKKEFISSFAIINGRCFVEQDPIGPCTYVNVIQSGKQETYYNSWATYQKVDAELTQYIGLKDKTGKEICEGDYLEFIVPFGECKGESSKSIVIWDELSASFLTQEDDSLDDLTYSQCSEDLAIVGNKFENPECEEKDNLQPGQPCKHPGCCSHISHPCEGCGRTGCR